MVSRAERRERTARSILDAARTEFAEHGYDGATIRAIAARAGVNASLVMQHHGSKAALFQAAARLVERDDVGAGDHIAEVVDARLTDIPPEVASVMRSMLTSADAAGIMRDYLQERIDRQTGALSQAGADADAGGAVPDPDPDPDPDHDPEADAAVIVAGVLGLTIASRFLAVPSLDRVGHERIAAAAQRLLGRAST